MSDSTTRFTNRVADYIKYRPHYPPQVLEFLQMELGLSPTSIVVDVGSGTGILAELFLRNGNLVYGIEPNQAMRQAAELQLSHYATFRSLNGTAEATTLEAGRADFVTAGQAFHWFEPTLTGQEFQRILKPAGWVVLIWNSWKPEMSLFLNDYEQLLQTYALDRQQVDRRNVTHQIFQEFFGNYQMTVFPNRQQFDYEGLQGRLLSSSYTPLADHANYAPMLAELRRLFEKYQTAGQVQFEYETKVYYGRF
jgi:ubiquinone/menaquinone biosynthesis C-methylase UbiE